MLLIDSNVFPPVHEVLSQFCLLDDCSDMASYFIDKHLLYIDFKYHPYHILMLCV